MESVAPSISMFFEHVLQAEYQRSYANVWFLWHFLILLAFLSLSSLSSPCRFPLFDFFTLASTVPILDLQFHKTHGDSVCKPYQSVVQFSCANVWFLWHFVLLLAFVCISSLSSPCRFPLFEFCLFSPCPPLVGSRGYCLQTLSVQSVSQLFDSRSHSLHFYHYFGDLGTSWGLDEDFDSQNHQRPSAHSCLKNKILNKKNKQRSVSNFGRTFWLLAF